MFYLLSHKMNLKLNLVFAFLTLTTLSFSQDKTKKKELSLKDAVLQQYRGFAPAKLLGFSFVPNSTEYAYFDKYTTLIKGDIKSGKIDTLLKINVLNEKLGTQLGYFSGFSWKNKEQFYVNDGHNYYLFDLVSVSGKKLFELDDKAENMLVANSYSSIAYTIGNNIEVLKNGSVTKITDNSDKNIVSGQSIARNEFGISKGMFWSNDENMLAFYQKDESEVADYPLLDIESTPGELVNLKYPMAGYKSEKPKVGIYNFLTGKIVYISPKRKVDDYLTNLAWTPDNKYVVIAELNREQNHCWLNVYDASTGEFVRSLFDEQNSKWVEPENPVYFPSKSSNNFIWISQRDGFNNLYYYDWESGKVIRQLTNNQFVAKNIVGAILKNSEIVFTATGTSPLDLKYFAVNLKGKQREITKNSGTHSLIIGKDGAFFYDEFSSHSIPNRSLLLNPQGNELKELLVSTDKLEDYQIGETVIDKIKTNEGIDLYYRLIKPSHFDPSKKYPVMVYVYGGPHAQMIQNEWLDGSNLWMHWLAEKGYLVYTIDNRGSANRGFEFESVIHRQLGTVEMEDQLLGVKFLKSLPYVDSNRLAIHGWSFGGFMTTSMLLRKPGTFKVGVAGGPVTDWKYYEIMYGERYMDLPEENPEGYKTASLLNHAQNLKGDLLLIHGTNDDVVVMQHNFALVKKFVELGIQMDFFPYPMHKHNVYGKDRVHLMEKVLNYIIENNK